MATRVEALKSSNIRLILEETEELIPELLRVYRMHCMIHGIAWDVWTKIQWAIHLRKKHDDKKNKYTKVNEFPALDVVSFPLPLIRCDVFKNGQSEFVADLSRRELQWEVNVWRSCPRKTPSPWICTLGAEVFYPPNWQIGRLRFSRKSQERGYCCDFFSWINGSCRCAPWQHRHGSGVGIGYRRGVGTLDIRWDWNSVTSGADMCLHHAFLHEFMVRDHICNPSTRKTRQAPLFGGVLALQSAEDWSRNLWNYVFRAGQSGFCLSILCELRPQFLDIFGGNLSDLFHQLFCWSRTRLPQPWQSSLWCPWHVRSWQSPL